MAILDGKNGDLKMYHPPTRDTITVFREDEKSFTPLLSMYELTQSRPKWRASDYGALVKKYQSWVYVCAKKNAETVAQTRIRLYIRGTTKRFPMRELEKGEKTYLSKQRQESTDDVREIIEHPLLKLLRLANPRMTGMELLELTGLYLELTGNSYWYMEGNGLGTPTEIWPLMSQYTWIVPSKTEFVKGYIYGRNYSDPDAQKYAPEQIMHFRLPNPDDQYYGLGPLKAALLAVNRIEAQAEYEQALWDNNARPDFAINAPIGMTAGQKERLSRFWEQRHLGPRRAGRPIILEGDMSIEKLGWSPRDTGLILAAKFTREEIAGIFGVPMTMLEVSKSRAEAEAGLYAYAVHTIQPRIRRMEQVLNEELVPLFDKRLFVAFDNPVPESRELELKEINTLARNGIVTRNEIRQREGFPYDEQFDEALIPAGMVPASQAGQQRGAQPAMLGGPFPDSKTTGQTADDEVGAQLVIEASEYMATTVPRGNA